MSQDTKFLIIVGGGKFGKKALDYAKKNKYTTILIDINPDCYCAKHADKTLDYIDDLNGQDLTPNCLYFLNRDVDIIHELIPLLNPEYVIPVVPIHLMASLVNSFLNENSIKLNPNNKLAEILILRGNRELILSHDTEQGVIYLSHAKIDEICPDNCAGPLYYCPNFKREKDITITQYLKDFYHCNKIISVEKNEIINITIIIESEQLEAGLGGLRAKDISLILKELKHDLNLINIQKYNVIIATTCNCHGVINFYRSY
jgi:hypothetical protein